MAEPTTKTIRLRAPVRSGHLIIPANAVVDATPAIAAELVGAGHAEPTDAIERYPNKPFLDVLNDYPVTGAEKFPRPDGVEPAFNPAAFGTFAAKDEAPRRDVVPAWDHPLKVGDEASPAKAGPPPSAAAAPAKAPAPAAPASSEAFAQPPAAARP